jgi:predicted anti-sigma-YlaC factor YlaD
MTCEWAERVSAYFDGEISDERKNDVQEHLKTCSECARYIERLRALESLRKNSVQEEVSQEQWDSCWQEIKQETTRRILKRRHVHFIRNLAILGAIAATVLIALTVWAVFKYEPSLQCTGVAEIGGVEILDYGAEYTPMVMETENATIIMVIDSGEEETKR